MNKRSFLKKLSLTALTSATLDKLPALAEHTEVKTKYEFVISITKNFLIPMDDGSFSPNVYGDYVILITRVLFPQKILIESRYLRFESPVIQEAELNPLHIKAFEVAVIKWIDQHPNAGTNITQFAPAISLTL